MTFWIIFTSLFFVHLLFITTNCAAKESNAQKRDESLNRFINRDLIENQKKDLIELFYEENQKSTVEEESEKKCYDLLAKAKQMKIDNAPKAELELVAREYLSEEAVLETKMSIRSKINDMYRHDMDISEDNYSCAYVQKIIDNSRARLEAERKAEELTDFTKIKEEAYKSADVTSFIERL